MLSKMLPTMAMKVSGGQALISEDCLCSQHPAEVFLNVRSDTYSFGRIAPPELLSPLKVHEIAFGG